MEIVDKRRETVLVAARSWAETVPGRLEGLEACGAVLLSDSDVRKFCVERDGDSMTVYTTIYEDGTETKQVHTVAGGLQDWSKDGK
jgi:hypothetical protein